MVSFRNGFATMAAAVFSIVLLAANPFSSGAPAGWTGAPGDSGTCVFCHRGSDLNSGGGSVVINAPDNYQPGVEYEFSVVVSDPVATRFGFQVTAKDDALAHAGEWTIVDGAGTSFAGTSVNYVTHSEPAFVSGFKEFQVKWKAPDTDIGDITFSAAGNGATLGGSDDDEIYASSKVVSQGGPTSTESEGPAVSFKVTDVFPVPFVEYTTFQFELARPGVVAIDVFDLTGREIYSANLGTFSRGAHSARLEADRLPGGVLLYRLTAGNDAATGRIVLLR